jgi:dihydroorotase
MVAIEDPLDMHVHLRDGHMLKQCLPHTAGVFSGALVMPNLQPPLTTCEAVIDYHSRILQEVVEYRHTIRLETDPAFQPYMTLFFQDHYDEKFLASMIGHIKAIKLYPRGMTTNSDDGVDPLNANTERVLAIMQEMGIPLCVHGETAGFVMDREREFVGHVYRRWSDKFPDLTIIMEHITTREAVTALDIFENLYATITVHHLWMTLDDVVGGMLQPHNFCKPIAKFPDDRKALRAVVERGHPKAMLGTDSAPHCKSNKHTDQCCAGVYSAPNALEHLVHIFEELRCLDKLQKFASGNAKRIYGLNPPRKTVELDQYETNGRPTITSFDPSEPVPWRTGEPLRWRISNVVRHFDDVTQDS